MNEICTRLKSLRINRNLTQTDVADALGVTTQAVSRWESHSTYPDISMLVPIADFYGVTTDWLLGHDSTEKENEILKYLEYCETVFFYLGNTDEWNDVLKSTRGMLRKYPTDHRLMLELCNELFMIYVRCDRDSKYLEEIIEWGSIITNKSTESEIRHGITKLMIYAYYYLGMYETVKTFVNAMPDLSESRDALQYFCNPPGTREAMMSEMSLAYKCFDTICSGMLKYGTNTEYSIITVEEKLSFCKTVISMILAYHPKEDYDGFTLEYLYRANLYAAMYYLMGNDRENGLASLKNALTAFERVESVSSSSYQSPFLKGLSVPVGCKKEHYRKLFRRVTGDASFDKIKSEDIFKDIEKKILDA